MAFTCAQNRHPNLLPSDSPLHPMSTWLSTRIASALSLNPDPPRLSDSTAPPAYALYARPSVQSQMDAFLLSPPPSLAFKSPDLHPYPSLSSPSPGSPLMLSSPISPPLSPRTFRSALANSTLTHSSTKAQQPVSYSPYSSFIDIPAARILSVGPGSSTSSDESRSPVDTSLDTDFDSMADYEFGLRYPYGSAVGGGYGGDMLAMSQSPVNDRKPHFSIEINPQLEDDGNGIPVSSPYGELPFMNSPLKQESYNLHSSIPQNDIHSYGAFLGLSSNNHPSALQHQHAQSYAAYASSSPESPFLDGSASAYYSSPGSVSTTHSAALVSIPQASYTLPMHAQAAPSTDTASAPMLISQAHSSQGAGAGHEGCDPRFVSVSPPQLGMRTAGSQQMAGRHTSSSPYSAIRFTGAFGSPGDAEGDVDGEFDMDADGEGDQEDEDGEERGEDVDDDEYSDAHLRIRSRSSLFVPSQAERISSITSSFDSSVGPSRNSMSIRLSRPTRPCAPAPVPVPNLTKKSRGRRVPTNPGVVVTSDGMARRARSYTCKVAGCGKCFARGEHLKRHVRSIHTNEKRK